MQTPCPQVADCVCDENPFENLSSELPDMFRYVRQYWASATCRSLVYSFISQADADAKARQLAEICDSPTGQLFGNDPLTLTLECP